MRAGEHTPAVEARRLWRGGGEGGCRWGGGERRETLRWLRHITVIVSHRERRECEVVRCRERCGVGLRAAHMRLPVLWRRGQRRDENSRGA